MKLLVRIVVALIGAALLANANLRGIDAARADSGAPRDSSGNLDFGPEEFVQANGVDIVVTGYSVPSFVRWNGDELPDLIVGDGGNDDPGKVRVYLNTGTLSHPEFGDYFYAQSNGADLSVPGSGCLGAFPRVVYWDGDDRKDLLIGRADGTVELFLNIGTDDEPTFDGGRLLQVGYPGEGVDIDVFYRATPTVVDWNNDGKKDLIVGSVDGLIYIYINEGTDTEPEFISVQYAMMDDGQLLSVVSTRSSPDVRDLDGDGKKDLLVGDRDGELLFYRNTASDAAPAFAPYTLARSSGVPVDLPGLLRSRPFVCDWTGDGLLDVLVGYGDGKVRLYQGVHLPGDLNCDGRVDINDVLHFVSAMITPEGYVADHDGDPYPPCDRMLADMNGDTLVDGADIEPFISVLLNPR
ncbi:MAG TPA: VCBS repeat-containing protein [Phycisphaerae bacterium]|nr:VCBS repeat-containing protein [Phycisphaerae bacterium]